MAKSSSNPSVIVEVAEEAYPYPYTSHVSSVMGEVAEEYPYPSHVSALNFVTVKLSVRDDFKLWKAQMQCLLVSHGMLGFTDGAYVIPEGGTSVSGKEKAEAWIRSDALVKGWILGSLSQQALRFILDRLHPDDHFTAKNIWDEIQTMYGPAVNINQQDGKHERITREAESTKGNPIRSLHLYIMSEYYLGIYGIIKRGRVGLQDIIDDNGNTTLHVAVGTSNNKEFLEKVLELASKSELMDLKNSYGSTLLHIAATVGNTNAAKLLLNAIPELLLVEDKDGRTPLARALSNMHTDTYLYLLKEMENPTLLGGTNDEELLINAISAKDFCSAGSLIEHYSTLNSDAVMMAIAQNYPSRVSRWQNICLILCLTVPCIILRSRLSLVTSEVLTWALNKRPRWLRGVVKGVVKVLWPFTFKRHTTHAQGVLCRTCSLIKMKPNTSDHYNYYRKPILEAARLNACEVVEYIVDYFPNAIRSENEDGHNIFQFAVINRSEKVYNLLYQMGERKSIYKTIKDSYGNNLLHLAGRLAPTDKLNLISGAALQIQHELQWFKEVEGFVCPLNKTQKNAFGETPQMVFTREHKNLVIEGEKWMKATAESYTITAALITTIVFAAAITVPGGSNGDTGIPIFTNDIAFTIFAVSDAVSLFTSTTSLLMFLSILTARFAERDFLFKLPTKLIIGLTTLFISTTAMIVAFGATLFLVFGQRKPWILGPIAALTCLPIASFVTLQYPLIADFMSATFGRSIFGKKNSWVFMHQLTPS